MATRSIERNDSVWTSREVGLSVLVGTVSACVAGLALRKFRQRQELMMKTPFLRSQQPFMRNAIERLPVKERQFLQGAFEAQIRARLDDLQIKAIELVGAHSRVWQADEWLAWIEGSGKLTGEIQEVCEVGKHFLTHEGIARTWAQMGPQEELVQIGVALRQIAPGESLNWGPQDWFDWLQKGPDRLDDLTAPLRKLSGAELEALLPQIAMVSFIGRHRQVYANFISSARRSIGPQWASWTEQQWLAALRLAPNNYYHPLNKSLRPLIDGNSPFKGLFPVSPLQYGQPNEFLEFVAHDLAARLDNCPNSMLQHGVAQWKMHQVEWSSMLSDDGRKLLTQLIRPAARTASGG